MKKATESHRKEARLAVLVALTVCLALSAWPQSQMMKKTGVGPVLTFSPGMASTTAGTGTSGYSGDGGPATSALLNFPMGVVSDGQGNLYVADSANNVIRKVSAGGTISTIAGNGTQGYSGDGGSATSAQLAFPAAVALDGLGNLFIADYLNSCVRKVDTNGIISTLATGFVIRGVAADQAGNVYYSSWYEGVWKVDALGVITRIAGNGTPGFGGDGGPAVAAQTSGVASLALDSHGNLYFAEVLNSDIRKVDTNGVITTVAGNQQFGFAGDGGPAASATLNGPTDVRIDPAGNLYIADSSNNRIRKVNAAGTIRTLAGDGNYGYTGDGGLASAMQFAGPTALALDGSGNLSIADLGNSAVRHVRVDSTTLDFGTVAVGQTGGPIRVIVSNAGDADLNVSGIVASSNFARQTTCSTTTPLAPGAECPVDVSFVPAVAGNIAGSVTFSDDATGNPHVINLKGVGSITPAATQLVLLGEFAIILPLGGNLGVVAVDAMDENGHLVTDFNGVVTLQIAGPAGFTPYSGQTNASGGMASFDLTAVILNVVGDYTLTVSSTGLSSSQVSFTVAANPDFAISTSKTSLTVGSSSAGSLSVNVTPTNGFSGTIALTCSGLPSHSTCSFVPASLQANGSDTALASVVTISTGVANVAANQHSDGPILLAADAGLFSMGLVGLVFAPLVRRNRGSQSRRTQMIQLILIAIILCGGLVGCGAIAGEPHSTPPGNYTITVTATSTGVSHSTTFTLAVH